MMSFFQALKGYERSSPWPEQSNVLIQLKNNLRLTVRSRGSGVPLVESSLTTVHSSISRTSVPLSATAMGSTRNHP
jgi:hypothetical protein